jgi:biotin carboxylase
MTINKKLAIIGSGRMAWIISRNAHSMGLITHCFSNNEPDYIHDEVDVFHNISIFEKDAIVDICRAEYISGVIATTELTVSIAAYVAEKIGTPGIPYQNSLHITDKFRNRMVCLDIKEITQPAFYRISDDSELNKTDFHYPIIIKPTGKGGKKGITVVEKPEYLLSAYKYAKVNSGEEPVIIEEYIANGQEYSVESLTCKGKHYIIQVTEKISSGPPRCVELGHHQPAAISTEMRNRIESALSKGFTAIGVDNTTCHTEIKIFDDKIYLIEFNARPGGDHIAWPLTELSTGYNIIRGAINISIDCFNYVDYNKFKNYYSGVYFVTQQTAYLKPLFDVCEKYDWLYNKNKVSEQLQSLEHNDCYGTNSIIYFSKEKRINLENFE